MANSYASNSILAKARAMFGKRLKRTDYDNLLNCGTVPEVLSYLKGHTKYASILNTLSEANVHRGQLEFILRQQLFYDSASLCRYEMSVGQELSRFLISHTEIEQLMYFLMLYSSDQQDEYLYSLPLYFTKLSSIDLQGLAKVKTYDDFLQTLVHSKYYKLLKPYKPKNAERLPLAEIENTLYTMLFDTVYHIIKTKTRGDQQKSLLNLFDTDIDLRNFIRILRLKKYYNATPKMIKKHLLPFGSLRDSQIDDMCNAQNSKEIFSIMQSTAPGKIISNMEYSYTGEIIKRGNYNLCRKEIRFSTYPSVVMLSYMTLAEIEVSNIINIIEGVRYQFDRDQMKDALVYKQ